MFYSVTEENQSKLGQTASNNNKIGEDYKWGRIFGKLFKSVFGRAKAVGKTVGKRLINTAKASGKAVLREAKLAGKTTLRDTVNKTVQAVAKKATDALVAKINNPQGITKSNPASVSLTSKSKIPFIKIKFRTQL